MYKACVKSVENLLIRGVQFCDELYRVCSQFITKPSVYMEKRFVVNRLSIFIPYTSSQVFLSNSYLLMNCFSPQSTDTIITNTRLKGIK